MGMKWLNFKIYNQWLSSDIQSKSQLRWPYCSMIIDRQGRIEPKSPRDLDLIAIARVGRQEKNRQAGCQEVWAAI